MVAVLKIMNFPKSMTLPKGMIYQVLCMIKGQFGHLVFNNQDEHDQWMSLIIQIKEFITRITYLHKSKNPGFDCVEVLKATYIPAVMNLIRIYGKTMVPTDIRVMYTDICRNISTLDEILILPDDYWPKMVEFDKTRCGFIGLNPSVNTLTTWHRSTESRFTGEDEIDLLPIELLMDEQDEIVSASIESFVVEDVYDEDDAEI